MKHIKHEWINIVPHHYESCDTISINVFCTSIIFKIEYKHYKKSQPFLSKKSVIFFLMVFLSLCPTQWPTCHFCQVVLNAIILINQYDQLSIWPFDKLAIIIYNIMYATYHKYVTSWITTWHCLVPSPINTFIHLHISLLYLI